MNTPALPLTGGCACGAIRYEAHAGPTLMLHCHCRDCQRSGGGPFSSFLIVPKEAFKLTQGTARFHASPSERSGSTHRGFCPDCGSPRSGPTRLPTLSRYEPGAWMTRAGSLPKWTCGPAMRTLGTGWIPHCRSSTSIREESDHPAKQRKTPAPVRWDDSIESEEALTQTKHEIIQPSAKDSAVTETAYERNPIMSANAALSDSATRRPAHKIATREEWLAERKKLLAAEKELTRRSDELARWRQELPWVRIDKDYRFDTDKGSVSLADLFQGRSQLLIYHFMFGPDYEAGCPSCTSIADGFDGFAVHLANHDVMFSAVSRAPLAKLQAYQQRMEWRFPWASSFGSGFNFDFHVSFTKEQEREGLVEYNYRGEPSSEWREGEPGSEGAESLFATMCGTDTGTYIRERPGMSSFILQDGVIYHTYSAYSRGLDGLWNMYQWLDRAPLGRNEADGPWWKRHDEYGTSQPGAGTGKGSCCCSSGEACA